VFFVAQKSKQTSKSFNLISFLETALKTTFSTPLLTIQRIFQEVFFSNFDFMSKLQLKKLKELHYFSTLAIKNSKKSEVDFYLLN
jgi:hypothetical protein